MRSTQAIAWQRDDRSPSFLLSEPPPVGVVHLDLQVCLPCEPLRCRVSMFRSSAIHVTLIAAFVVAGMLCAPVHGQEAAAAPLRGR